MRPFLYLASQSARRKEILRKMRIPFKQVRSRYRERMVPGVSPRKLTVLHAAGKAKAAVLPQAARWVLGADTLVYCQRRILGKPRTKEEAVRMLSRLSGRPHFVYTGVALLDRQSGKIKTGCAKTKVTFKRLTKEGILEYLESMNPYDKAGGYAIQEGPKIVKKIDGSRTNVIGLPVELLTKILRKSLSRDCFAPSGRSQ